jgi:hypothetical protein
MAWQIYDAAVTSVLQSGAGLPAYLLGRYYNPTVINVTGSKVAERRA